MENHRRALIHQNYIFILLISALLLSGFIFTGCGKKGPPEIIENSVIKIKPVKNLQYQIKENNVLLQWEASYKIPIDGFDIFMAKQNIKECQGCPVVFEKIDYLPPQLNQYKKELTKGYRYFFKIITLGQKDLKSNDSETVEIEFK